MSALKQYDVIFAGNYTKDTIITPGGVRHVDGGAVNYAAHAAACLGVRAAVVTRLAREDHRMIAALEAAGVDCYPEYTPSSTLMTLEYKTDDVDKRSLYVTDTAGTIPPTQLDGLEARAVVVGTSLRGEVGLDFFEAVRRRDAVILAADVQGFVRVLRDQTLVYEPWDEMAAVLQHVDILKSDMVEAEFLTGETDIEKAARFYANLGPKEIVLTHRDGVLIHAGGRDYAYTFHSASMDGRSGRGDTCLGSYVVSRFTLPPAEAGKQAAAVTSLKVERSGPFNRPMEDVQAFIQKHYGR